MGVKDFGAKHTITGDAKGVAIGYHYEVWGNSSDPMTWRQRNKTLKSNLTRQLKRFEVWKEENEVLVEQ